jgi:hypothetical protein
MISVVIANYIIITSDPHNRHATALWAMNITAAIASSLGIVQLLGKSHCYYLLKRNKTPFMMWVDELSAPFLYV